ncbi:iron-containing alcohol dehydrogenase [candidate division KSB1 bacterium]
MTYAEDLEKAQQILKDWKGDRYSFGGGALKAVGGYAAEFGPKTMLVVDGIDQDWMAPTLDAVQKSLAENQLDPGLPASGARPNAPREDVYRLALEIMRRKPDSIVAVGGGSTIDAVKGAAVLATWTPDEVKKHLEASDTDAGGVDPFLGVDTVAKISRATGKGMLPVVAVQMASSSAAHLTKYSNITDPVSGIKKLIIDMAIVPPAAVFDYGVTASAPPELTLDGALDGISHVWEVAMGGTGRDFLDEVTELARIAVSLIVHNLPKALKDPSDIDARTGLGLATDLGGRSIMVGGTNGGHLGSFQLVSYLSHGRACHILNPYYTVLFAPAIQKQLRAVGPIYQQAGYIESGINLAELSGTDLARTVAGGMTAFARSLGFPTTLKEAGVPQERIEVMVEQAKNPQLASKLQNMPTPMETADVDPKMDPTLQAAFTGDFSLIPE